MKTDDIFITTPFIKLDQLIKFSGVSMTGGDAKYAIVNGYVRVNGEICQMRGKKLYPEDVVEISDIARLRVLQEIKD